MSEPNICTIGERTFHQEKLAWRQIKLVLAQVEGLSILNMTPLGIIAALGAKLSAVFGIVLIPDEENRQQHLERLKDPKKFLEHVNFIEDYLELDLAAEVLRDFLSLNQISYVSEVLTAVQAKLTPAPSTTPSNGSAPSSPAATPPLETVSSI